MLAALLLVFREVLEAALIVSVVAAATRDVPGRGRWIGGGIVAGVVLGGVLYAGLLRIPLRHFFSATNGLLLLLASGLAAAAAGDLVQADVLPALASPLWDTGWLLDNHSVTGQTLHVLVGYTARPDGVQMIFYVATALALLAGMRWSRQWPPRAAAEPLSSATNPV